MPIGTEAPGAVAHVIVDVATRALDRPSTTPSLKAWTARGWLVRARRLRESPVVGYVVGLAVTPTSHPLKPVQRCSAAPTSRASAPASREWIAAEYLCPLSEAVGSSRRRVARHAPCVVRGGRRAVWSLQRPGVGPVDDRWASVGPDAESVSLAPTRPCSARCSMRCAAGPSASRSSRPISVASTARSRLSSGRRGDVERRRRMRERSRPRSSRRGTSHSLPGSRRRFASSRMRSAAAERRRARRRDRLGQDRGLPARDRAGHRTAGAALRARAGDLAHAPDGRPVPRALRR